MKCSLPAKIKFFANDVTWKCEQSSALYEIFCFPYDLTVFYLEDYFDLSKDLHYTDYLIHYILNVSLKQSA